MGLRNLEKAGALTTTPITVHWEPFLLNGNTPEEGEDLEEHISKKYGPAMAARFSSPDNPLTQAGRKVGINFNPARRVISTLRCHVVVDHVNKEFGIDKGNELMKVLFRCYFEEAKDVNNKAILLDCVAEVLGDACKVAFAPLLDDETLASQVRAKDHLVKTRMRVSGVPYFIIGANALSGAQPPEVIAEAIEDAKTTN